ncbi:hypothetical protein VIGAN_02262700, partial [Vigna angularis var. angularis]
RNIKKIKKKTHRNIKKIKNKIPKGKIPNLETLIPNFNIRTQEAKTPICRNKFQNLQNSQISNSENLNPQIPKTRQSSDLLLCGSMCKKHNIKHDSRTL